MSTLGRFLYRGTTRGWPGSRSSQRLGITSASSDPLVATLFALHCYGVYGQGVVYAAKADDLQSLLCAGNVLNQREREIGLQMTCEEFQHRAIRECHALEVRQHLVDLGFKAHLPERLLDNEALNRAINLSPRLTSEELRNFETRFVGV